MKLIDSSYEIFDQISSFEDALKMVEKAGRVCYKSEDKITEDSYKRFVDMIKNNKHTAMLEHATIYLYRKSEYGGGGSDDIDLMYARYNSNKFSDARLTFNGKKEVFITTNYRVIIDNAWEDDLEYFCAPTENHVKRYTVKFTFDIGLSREAIRHRLMSFANESTRYCNYTKDKFDGSVTFIKPHWYGKQMPTDAEYEFIAALDDAERHYNRLIELGLSPQDARSVLPLATKSELVMTGTTDQWQAFFDLRALGLAGKPHPDINAISKKLMDEFKERQYI